MENKTDNISGLNTTEEKTDVYPEGAIFSIFPGKLPIIGASNYFNYLNASTNVLFPKAKALYDMNIAVLKLEAIHENILKDLTYESDYFCLALSSYLGKYAQCLKGSDYKAYRSDVKNKGKTAFVFISIDDIKGGERSFLMTDDPDESDVRFGLLIIPDIVLGSETLIKQILGDVGIARIKKFVEKGGLIYAEGKGAIVLEMIGLVESETFRTKDLLTTVYSSNLAKIKGCENQTLKNPKVDDILAQTICFTVPSAYIPLVGSYLVNKGKGNFTTYLNFDENFTYLRKKSADTGIEKALPEEDKTFLPLVMYKEVGKGKIFVLNAHPVLNSGYYHFFYNILLAAMSRNILVNSYVGFHDAEQLPIPGGK